MIVESANDNFKTMQAKKLSYNTWVKHDPRLTQDKATLKTPSGTVTKSGALRFS